MAYPRIFLSYRREDTNAHANWIYTHLVSHLGPQQVFLDADNIPPGEDFSEYLGKSVASCDVLFAIIGKSWLTITDETGRPRLFNPEDFVVVEIEQALRRGVRVIPVLVGGAQMPQKIHLPEALWPLARKQKFDLPDNNFIAELNRLLEKLEAAQGSGGDKNHTPTTSAQQIRDEITAVLSAKLQQPLFNAHHVRTSRGMLWSADKKIRVVLSISKRHPAGNFWFGYQPYWHDFLSQAERGFYVLGCVGRTEAFVIPFDWMRKTRDFLNTTESRSRIYYHINIRPDASGELFLHLKNGERRPLGPFATPLSARAATAS